MPDAAFKNASAKRDALAREINSLQQQVHDRKAELTAVEEWLASWHIYAGAQSDDRDEPSDEEHSQNVSGPFNPVEHATERSRTTGNPKKEFVATNARRIIEEAGQPVSRSDLFKELGLRGVHIEGKDPEQVLSTMMWRTRDLVRVTRLPTGGYWLAEQPHEASGYDPGRPITAVDQMLSTPMAEIGRHESNELTEGEARTRYAALSTEIAEADRLYHQEDAPEISDAAYDALRRELEGIEARFPNFADNAAAGAKPSRSLPPLDDELPPPAPSRNVFS